MEPTWVLSAPDGPHNGPMNLANRVYFMQYITPYEAYTAISNHKAASLTCIIYHFHYCCLVWWIYCSHQATMDIDVHNIPWNMHTVLFCLVMLWRHLELIVDLCAVFIHIIQGLLYLYGLTLIPAWISDYIHCEMWGEINHPLQNFKGTTVGVWEWTSNFTLKCIGHVITYPCWD